MGYFLQILEEREEQPQKVLEKDPVGSKVLESYVCVSNSEIKAEKEQPDHEDHILNSTVKFTFSQSSSHSPHWPLISLV